MTPPDSDIMDASNKGGEKAATRSMRDEESVTAMTVASSNRR